MIFLLIVLASVFSIYLLIRFAKYVVGIYLILCAGFVASFPIMVYNFDFGIMLALWCALLIICVFLLVMLSGIMGALITGFIIGPISMFWLGFRTMLFKMK